MYSVCRRGDRLIAPQTQKRELELVMPWQRHTQATRRTPPVAAVLINLVVCVEFTPKLRDAIRLRQNRYRLSLWTKRISTVQRQRYRVGIDSEAQSGFSEFLHSAESRPRARTAALASSRHSATTGQSHGRRHRCRKANVGHGSRSVYTCARTGSYRVAAEWCRAVLGIRSTRIGRRRQRHPHSVKFLRQQLGNLGQLSCRPRPLRKRWQLMSEARSRRAFTSMISIRLLVSVICDAHIVASRSCVARSLI